MIIQTVCLKVKMFYSDVTIASLLKCNITAKIKTYGCDLCNESMLDQIPWICYNTFPGPVTLDSRSLLNTCYIIYLDLLHFVTISLHTLNLLVNNSSFVASSSVSYNGCRLLRQHRRTSPLCETNIYKIWASIHWLPLALISINSF